MKLAPVTWRLRTEVLSNADHTLLMGVVNVTPDSFSDGGNFYPGGSLDPDAAIAHGLSLLDAGADVVDVGGESTRPGSTGINEEEELARVLPVVSGLVESGCVVSIDTSKPAVARAAVDAGAEAINDVTGLRNPEMVAACAETDAGVVIMHMLGTPRHMQDHPRYDDVVREVGDYLLKRADEAVSGGVSRERICIDPGIGFGKTFDHNLQLLREMPELTGRGYPVMVGASRKTFLGAILADAGVKTDPADRDAATAATVAAAVLGGAAMVRVHNVAMGLQVARTADAIVRSSPSK